MELELARHHWDDGRRRVEEARRDDRRRYDSLMREIELVLAVLRSRVGQTFTLVELADVYDDADLWVRDLLDDADPEGSLRAEPGVVADAAFDRYSHGASDYRP
ncbi:MAG TPA: hypothetical protein VF094_02535 [Gaiellaceae bacterium]